MIRTPGALWASQLPTGEWAELIPGKHVSTHLGVIALPGFDVGFLAITNVGHFKIAGQAQVDRHDPNIGTWEWSTGTGAWRRVSAESPGTYPAIYDAQGQLHIATPERNGSQGWRYVAENGELVTGDQTLNAMRDLGVILGLRDFWQYSFLGGVVIGQGETGCDVRIEGVRRRLEDGDTHAIRVAYDPISDRWGIGMTKLAQGQTARGVFTRAQLRALPAVPIDAAPSPIPVPPNPAPKPEPPPVSIPAELNNQLALVTEVRNALYPDKIGQPLNDNAKAFQITKGVAWRLRHLGVGLVKAKAGSDNNVEGYTSDAVALKSGAHWDVLVGSEEGAFPNWDLVPEQHWPAVAPRWAAPIDPGTSEPVDPGEPGEQPLPPAPAGSIDSLVRALVASAVAAATAPLYLEIAALRQEIAARPDQPAPSFPTHIALKSAHGWFGCVEPSGRMVFDRPSVGGWEVLEVIPQ